MQNLSTFQREYLWELEIPRKQVIELAEAIPEEAYDWRPAEDARTVAAVLVHIAAGNLLLLCRAGVELPAVVRLRGPVQGTGTERWLEMVRKSIALERCITSKQEVLELLRRSFDAVREALTATNPKQLGLARELFGEVTTYRRIYLRILAHADEHMGQAIGYARTMGFRVPWPDPIRMMEEMAAKAPVA